MFQIAYLNVPRFEKWNGFSSSSFIAGSSLIGAVVLFFMIAERESKYVQAEDTLQVWICIYFIFLAAIIERIF